MYTSVIHACVWVSLSYIHTYMVDGYCSMYVCIIFHSLGDVIHDFGIHSTLKFGFLLWMCGEWKWLFIFHYCISLLYLMYDGCGYSLLILHFMVIFTFFIDVWWINGVIHFQFSIIHSNWLFSWMYDEWNWLFFRVNSFYSVFHTQDWLFANIQWEKSGNLFSFFILYTTFTIHFLTQI